MGDKSDQQGYGKTMEQLMNFRERNYDIRFYIGLKK